MAYMISCILSDILNLNKYLIYSDKVDILYSISVVLYGILDIFYNISDNQFKHLVIYIVNVSYIWNYIRYISDILRRI